MPLLVTLALGWKWPVWAARLFGWALPLLAAGALVGVTIAVIYHRGETAGGARVAAKVEAAQARAVSEARTDERAATTVAATIDHRVAIADDQTTALVRSRMTEINNVLSSTPGTTAADTHPPVFDAGSVRTSLNTLVDDANRAADTADAER